MVLFVRLEVLGQFRDPLTQNRNLHLGGTGIRGMDPVRANHPAFDVCRQCHLKWMLLVFS
jgi:hypothetical protein